MSGETLIPHNKFKEARIDAIRRKFSTFYQEKSSKHGTVELAPEDVKMIEDSVVDAVMIDKLVLGQKARALDQLAITSPFMTDQIKAQGPLFQNYMELKKELLIPADDGKVLSPAAIEVRSERVLRGDIAIRLTQIRLAEKYKYTKGKWDEYCSTPQVQKASNIAQAATEHPF